jgi:hypothetical protein
VSCEHCGDAYEQGIRETETKFRAVIDAARQLREDRNNGLDMYDAAVAVCRAIEELDNGGVSQAAPVHCACGSYFGEIHRTLGCPQRADQEGDRD